MSQLNYVYNNQKGTVETQNQRRKLLKQPFLPLYRLDLGWICCDHNQHGLIGSARTLGKRRSGDRARELERVANWFAHSWSFILSSSRFTKLGSKQDTEPPTLASAFLLISLPTNPETGSLDFPLDYNLMVGSAETAFFGGPKRGKSRKHCKGYPQRQHPKYGGSLCLRFCWFQIPR